MRQLNKELSDDQGSKTVKEYLQNPEIVNKWKVELNVEDNIKHFLLVVGVSDGYFKTIEKIPWFDILSQLPIEIPQAASLANLDL